MCRDGGTSFSLLLVLNSFLLLVLVCTWNCSYKSSPTLLTYKSSPIFRFYLHYYFFLKINFHVLIKNQREWTKPKNRRKPNLTKLNNNFCLVFFYFFIFIIAKNWTERGLTSKHPDQAQCSLLSRWAVVPLGGRGQPVFGDFFSGRFLPRPWWSLLWAW